jgi:hypothetical protein
MHVSPTHPKAQIVTQAMNDWLDTMVIGLNLCPFAKAAKAKQGIVFLVSDAITPSDALLDAHQLLMHLNQTPETITETALLSFPDGFHDFMAFLDMVALARSLLSDLKLDGIFQWADFHPHYQFADTEPNDVANYTNRAPYPSLHLLRESSIDRAVKAFPDAANIYERNIALLQSMGLIAVKQLNTPSTQRK